MSRAYRFVVVGVVWIICTIMHRIAVELFQPGSPLYKVATDGTEAMNGQARVDLWFEILSVWMPLMVGGGILVWALFTEYKQQAITGSTTARRP